jgi:hypothetical protein
MPLPGKAKAQRLKARKCKYCRATFYPKRAAGKEAKFCSAAHRKNFWRYGGLPFDKLLLRMELETKRLVRDEIRKMVRPDALAGTPPEEEPLLTVKAS